MRGFVELGHGTIIRVSEIVAVHNGCDDRESARMPVTPYEGARAVVILRGGISVPSYIGARALRRRIHEAQQAEALFG